MEEVRYNNFFTDIQSIASEKGVNLTYANKRLYLSLLQYVQSYHHESQITENGVSFHTTISELAEFCEVSRRTVSSSLQKLQKCGLVAVQKEEKTFFITVLDSPLFRAYCWA